MENNVALNLREVADKVNEEAKQAKIALHKEAVETKIIPFLRELAANGEYQTDFSTPGYNAFMMRDILRELGFTVDTRKFANSHHLFVQW